ncbi:T9SS type A sorting domain-containing protein [Flagellimonas olearia]|uniref:T9SS type A sorting domain-containing protein n=1 Tax=Flagellimonas olearia TaxID=552546 RepID=A0A6I1E3I3_9FLAO|nr:YCF48-related protein [Allomuricauda olearia]KAB7531182.1 T9SS type A sorting domain-containing protein [Allomuricauda olearia]
MNKHLLSILVSILAAYCALGQENWEVLNPKPTLDRGLDIHFVSETHGFYITSNGLYETVDSGNFWELKISLSGGSDIEFREDLGVIAGYGGNIWKTGDSGSNWTLINVGFTESLNTVNIIDSETIIVSGNNSIYVSVDGGNNWVQKNIPNSRVNKTFFTNNLVGHAVSDDGQILKTVDGGDNWYVTADFTNFIPNSFFTVYFKNENEGFATREHSEYYKTVDGGESWQEIATSIYQAIYSFQFISDQIGFGAGEYGVYKTIDGGDTWTRIAFESAYVASTDMYGVYFINENEGFSVGDRGRIAKTTDSGEIWDLYSPIDGRVDQIDFLPNGNGIIKVGSDFFGSLNNGQDWDYLGTPNEGSYTEEFDFIDENIGFCIAGGSTGTSSRAGQIYKTADGGKTWVKPENFGLSFESSGANCLEFVNENLGFISGGFNQRRTYKTTDGGEIWRVVLSESLGRIQFLNEDVGFGSRVGNYYNVIFKTIDGGENWSQVFTIEENIKDFHFLDLETGYLVGDEGLLYKTENGGSTWTKLELPYGYYEKIQFYSKNVGYVVEDSGYIYKTEDGGYTWNLVYALYGLRDITITEQDEIFIVGINGNILRSQVTAEDVVVRVSEATDVRATSVSIESIFASNSGTLTNLRLEYGEEGSFDQIVPFNRTIEKNENIGFLTATAETLKPNTTYTYRAVATYNGEEYYSNIGTVTTLENYSFSMGPVLEIWANSATPIVNVISNNKPLTNISFEYGIDSEDDENEISGTPNTVTISDDRVNVSGSLINLQPETTYSIRAKAVYDNETVYSDTVLFTTRPEFRVDNYNPIVSDLELTLRANIAANKEDLTEIVFEYGFQDFSNQGEVSPNSIAFGTSYFVSTILTGLNEMETYQYRIRARQGDKVVYGPTGFFSLSPKTIVENDGVQNVKRNVAEVMGKVYTNDGYLRSIVVEYGIGGEFDRIAYADPGFSNTGFTTLFVAQLLGLVPETEYSYRVRATGSNGTVFYSEAETFITLDALASDNFKITVSDETCPDKSNGTLAVEAMESSNYILLMDGNSYVFASTLLIEDLAPGTYPFCVTEGGYGIQYCYEFTILESEGLEAKISSQEMGLTQRLNITMNKGTAPYKIFVNQQEYDEFEESSFSINVGDGDEISIASKNDCEGTYSFKIGQDILQDSYRNPVFSNATFLVPESNEDVTIELYNVQGGLLKSFTEKVQNNSFTMDMDQYSRGMYFVKIIGRTERTHKIVKK